MIHDAGGESESRPDDALGDGLFARIFRATSRPWTWVVIALIALMILPALYVQYSILRIPVVGPPFDVAAHKATKVDVSKNAFVDYSDAHRLLNNGPFPGDSKRFASTMEAGERVIKEGWSAATDDLRHWMKLNESGRAIWRRGTEQDEGIEVPLDELTINSLIPATQSIRTFSHFARLEATRLMDEGKTGEAWEWIRATLRSSRHVGQHSTAIGRLIGVMLVDSCKTPILRWGARPETSADDLRRALRDLETIRAMTPPVSNTFKNEYLMIRQTPISELPDLKSNPNQWILRLTGLLERNRRTEELLFANWLSQCDLPRFERKPAASQRVSGLFEPGPASAASGSTVQPDEIANWMQETHDFATLLGAQYLSLMAPAAGQIIQATDREAAQLANFQLSLALQSYYRAHGEFPEKLEQLLGAELKSLPADPFGKGETMRYRREPDPKAGATVWSIGEDGIDQDGRIEQSQEGPKVDEFGEVIHVLPPAVIPKPAKQEPSPAKSP